MTTPHTIKHLLFVVDAGVSILIVLGCNWWNQPRNEPPRTRLV